MREESAFKVMTRIGPMEGGARDGTYLEEGEKVTADVFRPESVPLLLDAERIVPWTDEMELAAMQGESGGDAVVVEVLRNAEGMFVSPKDQDADGKPEPILKPRRSTKKESNDGTNDTHSS